MRKRRKLFPDLQRKIFIGGLAVMLAWSIVAALIALPPSWQIPSIFAALLMIIRMVSPIEDMEESIQSIRTSVEAPVTRYGGAEDLYRDLAQSVRSAVSYIDLTHIRDNPPADFKGLAPTEYFTYLLNWLAASNSRTIRRVICIRNAEMRAWAVQLHEATRARSNLHIRVIECGSEIPIINVAIIDGNKVYMTFTGDIPERTPGAGIDDAATSHYFTEYYAALWRASEPLESYLQHH